MNNIPVVGCLGCQTAAGSWGCPEHSPNKMQSRNFTEKKNSEWQELYEIEREETNRWIDKNEKLQTHVDKLGEIISQQNQKRITLEESIKYYKKSIAEEMAHSQQAEHRIKELEICLNKLGDLIEKNKNITWETCDCSMDFNKLGDTEECGCGEKHCRLYRDKTIHWRGKHWRLGCAFDHAVNLLKEFTAI